MPYKQMQDVEFRQFLGSRPPTIAGWNRLEGQPRSVDLEGGLSFDICDALWMVGRQLQFRELRGESAASPVSAKIKYSSRRIDRVRLGDRPVERYDDSLPLEVRAEREHPPLNLRFALEAGRLWTKYLAMAMAGAALSRDPFDDFLAAFPIVLPAESPGAADVHAHQTVLELYSLAAGRAIHGAALYAAARAFREGTGPDPLDALALAPSPADRLALGDLIEAWFRAMRARYTLDQHSEGGAWRPEALGYSLSCSAPSFDGGARIVLAAKDYRRGHLDWYSFDIGGADDPAAAPLPDSGEDPPAETKVEEFVPSLARFAGMPALRLWEFENRKTNFGRITAYTTDLARLIFAEYGLAFGNDWFLFPLETEAGRILQIDGLVVTDTFGERVWVPAFGQDSGRPWERWATYVNASEASGNPASRLLLVADSIDTLQQSKPQEVVEAIRDEIANMVFAIESRITLDDGRPADGFEAFQARRRFRERIAPPSKAQPASGGAAPIAYRLMMDNIPENWIPFVPVRITAGDNREIQLQRARLLRDLGGSSPEAVPPRTQILRPDYPKPYFVHEEQVPRAGVRVVQTFQRTRHSSGRPIIWCGRSTSVGHGQGSSGLAFDRILPR